MYIKRKDIFKKMGNRKKKERIFYRGQ